MIVKEPFLVLKDAQMRLEIFFAPTIPQQVKALFKRRSTPINSFWPKWRISPRIGMRISISPMPGNLVVNKCLNEDKQHNLSNNTGNTIL
jgi:hypothetical protein